MKQSENGGEALQDEKVCLSKVPSPTMDGANSFVDLSFCVMRRELCQISFQMIHTPPWRPINTIMMTIFCRKRFSTETESMRGTKGFVPLFDVFLYRTQSPHTKPINNNTSSAVWYIVLGNWDPALFPFAPCDLIPPRVTWPIILSSFLTYMVGITAFYCFGTLAGSGTRTNTNASRFAVSLNAWTKLLYKNCTWKAK